MEKIKNIGLIAGNGSFPLILCKRAKEKGIKLFAAAHKNETDPEIENLAYEVKWIHLGQVKQIIKFFKDNDIKEAVMMGAITKTKMFSDLKPDLKALSIIAGMICTHDDAILRAFASALEKEGIKIISSTFLIPDLIAQKGCWTKRKPTDAEKADIKMGMKLAIEIGRLDIGQCVVIAGGSIVAVEAIEGTDAAIKRGGTLCRGDASAVAVKICKPNQDRRFDIPAVGTNTVNTMKEAGVNVLAVEAGKAIVFDKEEMVKFADKNRMSIVAIEPDNF